ncbi:MAG: galactose-1-phosphate uridylyltransferase [Ignavibacteriae bacterium]|nr:galactose-1-phosphate uridylyltransferase [Ignavibacteriota bacterium]
MPEFRQNFVTKEWVIIAPERAKRPSDYRTQKSDIPARSTYDPTCPFCPGNETETGAEMLRYGTENAWSLRVIRNKYSALDPGSAVLRHQAGLFLTAGNHGVAEVVIESPLHNLSFSSLPPEGVVDVLRSYRERSQDIGSMPDISMVIVFRNHGPGAGTSLSHPHSQIIASPIIPPHLRDPIHLAALHLDSFGSCVYCDMLAEELRQEYRIIEENDHFVSYCPFASRSPYEVRILPKRHAASFTLITDTEIASLAEILQHATARIRDLLADPSYNFVIRSSPISDEDVRYLHWYLVLIPKITTPAGFEIGSGIYINPSSPEVCARHLRGEAVS